MNGAIGTARAESTPRVLLIALGVAVLCSLIVATAVELLRPRQLAYQALDRNRVIVQVAGLADADHALSDREVVERFRTLEVHVVDLATGRFSDAVDALGYDQRAAAGIAELSVSIDPALDVAGLGRRARYAPIYIHRDGPSIERIVLPVHGQGMWSTIYGYVALENDLSTIADVAFAEHGETPGIGDQIEVPQWRSSWRGKPLFDASGKPALFAAPPGATRSALERYRVDAIAGATLTVDGVMNAVRYWFGEDGFGPFLAYLRSAQPLGTHQVGGE